MALCNVLKNIFFAIDFHWVEIECNTNIPNYRTVFIIPPKVCSANLKAIAKDHRILDSKALQSI